MATAGVGSLTPQQVADRAERWFGARVDYRTTGKIKIYPKDSAQPLVVIADRWSNGSDRLNSIKRLQRAGLDVINGQTPPDSLIKADGRSVDSHLTQKIELPETAAPTERTEPVVSTPKPTPASIAPRPATNGVKQPPFRAADEPVTRVDYDALLAMLAEAETRDQARRAEVAELRRVVDSQAKVIERLDQAAAQNRASMARLHKRVGLVENSVDAVAQEVANGGTSGAAAQIEAERRALVAEAIEWLERTGAKVATGSLAASLGKPDKGNTLGKLMASAAKDPRTRVKTDKYGTVRLYWVEPQA